MVPSGDNLFCMLSYRAYGTPDGLGGRWVGWGGAAPVALLATPGWDRSAYLKDLSQNPDNSLHAPPLPAARRMSGPLLVEYAAGNPAAARYLKPTGYLFQVEASPVSDSDALTEETSLHAHFPELFRPATGREHRLEREARGLMHQNRAAYFFERGLWQPAGDAFTLACTFLPDDGKAWFSPRIMRARSGRLSCGLRGVCWRLALTVLRVQAERLSVAEARAVTVAAEQYGIFLALPVMLTWHETKAA